MRKQTRSSIALFCVLSLLLLQAVPAFAVCVCNTPGDRACCEREVENESAAKDCCATSDVANLSAHCESQSLGSDGASFTANSDGAVIGTAPCEQQISMQSVTAIGVLNINLENVIVNGAFLAPVQVGSLFPSSLVFQTTTVRGPPEPPTPYYVLYSALLI